MLQLNVTHRSGIDETPVAQRGGTDLVSCSNVTKTDTSYCCDGYRAFCCDEGVARFDVFPSNPEVLARWDAQKTQFVVVQRPSSSSVSSQATSTGSTLSTSTTTTPPPTGTDLPTGSPNPNTGPGSEADSQSQSQPAAPSLSVAAQAGIGAGAGVLAIALAVIAFLLFKLRKKKKEQIGGQEQTHQYRGQGPGELYDHKMDVPYPPYNAPPQEVDGRGPRFELPATPRRGF
jgi:hypothetical protein